MEVFLAQDAQSQEGNNSICILPWIHQYFEIEGCYSACCFALKHKFGKDLSPAEAFNSDEMKKLRLAMLSDKKPITCNICYDFEKNGINSHRKRMNSGYSDYTKLYHTTKEDGSINTPPIYLDVRFGNLCNFTCRMCGSYASSSWIKEEKYNGSETARHYDYWTSNDEFWKYIEDIKNHMRFLYFAGGEPFVQEGHYMLLDLLIKNGCSKNISLSYNTNLSYNGVFKGYDIEQLWKEFKKVELWPSIEGFEEKAEYGRKGLDFDLFKKNSIKFSKYINTFSIVSSVFSISSNIELIKWIKSINKQFSISNLENNKQHKTTIFSTELKRKILKDYKNQINDITLTEYELTCVLDSLRHMMSQDDSHLAKGFKERNTKSDLFRNESFESVFPELAEWYKNI